MLISRKRQQVFTVAEIEWNEIRAPRLVIGFNQPGLICIKKQNLHGMSMAGLPYFFFSFSILLHLSFCLCYTELWNEGNGNKLRLICMSLAWGGGGGGGGGWFHLDFECGLTWMISD